MLQKLMQINYKEYILGNYLNMIYLQFINNKYFELLYLINYKIPSFIIPYNKKEIAKILILNKFIDTFKLFKIENNRLYY